MMLVPDYHQNEAKGKAFYLPGEDEIYGEHPVRKRSYPNDTIARSESWNPIWRKDLTESCLVLGGLNHLT